jgi:3'-phosphoadenosine 5'-phosphosulfate sulfotransferase (PAPS reductase)/FAD synthetase
MDDNLPILISFSGGRTSAFMAKLLMEHEDYYSREKVVVFANTGKEFDETLDFVNECDKRWGLNVVWLEAKVDPEKGVGTTFKIVDYEIASRNGKPFEEVIAKYGIPNKQFPHCTRELKQMPIKKYMQSLGYKEWITAVGIRADEPHRINRGSDSNFINPFFPLNDIIKVDEEFIRNWWSRQDFDLNLKDYQSNCDLCWKKSKRKRLTLIEESPSVSEWWESMEDKYGGDYRFDQREGLSIVDLVEMAQRPFHKAVDQHELRQSQPSMFDPDMDMEWDCFCKST